MTKVCGDCIHHNAAELRCRLGMSYAAFVYPDTPAHGCPWHTTARQMEEAHLQSQTRGDKEQTDERLDLRP